MSNTNGTTIHPTSASADAIVTSLNSTTEDVALFLAQCESANAERRAVKRLREYFDWWPNNHIAPHGYIGTPESDPAEHEEFVSFAVALVNECDEYLAAYGRWGSTVRKADLIFDMGIEAYLAGHDAGRIERAIRLLLVESPSLDEKLDKYGTTVERCSCPDKWAGRERLCKHQIAIRMLERLQKPWNEQVTTFEQPSADVDDIEIPF